MNPQDVAGCIWIMVGFVFMVMALVLFRRENYDMFALSLAALILLAWHVARPGNGRD
jgi:uncharacterized membrane protein